LQSFASGPTRRQSSFEDPGHQVWGSDSGGEGAFGEIMMKTKMYQTLFKAAILASVAHIVVPA
jgi:hypothetical protein